MSASTLNGNLVLYLNNTICLQLCVHYMPTKHRTVIQFSNLYCGISFSFKLINKKSQNRKVNNVCLEKILQFKTDRFMNILNFHF